MSGQNFTPRQEALLSDQFANATDGSIQGSWLADGTLPWSKTDAATAYTDLDTRYATTAQGTNADTAFGWGDHSVEGYLTAATTPQGRRDSVTAAGGETTLTLANTPVGKLMVLYTPIATGTPVAWRETTDYTVSGAVLTYVSITPLVAGDLVDVFYVG